MYVLVNYKSKDLRWIQVMATSSELTVLGLTIFKGDVDSLTSSGNMVLSGLFNLLFKLIYLSRVHDSLKTSCA